MCKILGKLKPVFTLNDKCKTKWGLYVPHPTKQTLMAIHVLIMKLNKTGERHFKVPEAFVMP